MSGKSKDRYLELRSTAEEGDPVPDWYEVIWSDGQDLADRMVEGSTLEMIALARAILDGDEVRFKRCAVDATKIKRGRRVLFSSPRNGVKPGIVSAGHAVEFANMVLAKFNVVR